MADYVEDRGYYSPGIIIARIVNGIVGIIEFMLFLRFVLQLLGANPASPFIGWVYQLTDALMGPFVGAFPPMSFAGFQVDFSIIFAMIGYAIIGWLILRLASLFFDTS